MYLRYGIITHAMYKKWSTQKKDLVQEFLSKIQKNEMLVVLLADEQPQIIYKIKNRTTRNIQCKL